VIDLHTHSIYSDGTHSPAELVALAEKRGLHALALTDHDTIGGVPELIAAAQTTSVEAITGLELSAECERGTMHILGYFVDIASPLLQEKIDILKQSRAQRNLEILKKLNKLGCVMRWSDVEKHAGCDVVGRPHFAAALVERGCIKSKKAAFECLLAKGRPAYVERQRYSAKECIELIRAANGIPVLAHPATIFLPNEALLALICELKDAGLGGLETYYAENYPQNSRKFSKWADDLGLIRTGGTDFHGKNSPDLKIGTGFGKLRVPDEVVDQLRAALK